MAFRVALVAVVVLVAVAGSALLYWDWVPLHRGSYATADRSLRASVGAPAGATLVSESVQALTPASNADFVVGPQRTIGYALWSEYSLARSMKLGAFLAFFRRRLTGWSGYWTIRSQAAWAKREPHYFVRGHASFSFTPQTAANREDVTGFTTVATANDPYSGYRSP